MKHLFLILLVTSLFACEDQDGLLSMDDPGNLVPKTVMEDPRLPSITVNGTKLHAEAFGNINNPILIFLHGGPGGDYRAFISEKGFENASRYPDQRNITHGGLSQLQDEFYCVFYDQRGAGLSQRFEKGIINSEIYIEDLNGVINHYLQKKQDEIGVIDPKVSVFAWSYGGILATEYINKYPERIKDVIFYEPGPLARNVREYLMENMTGLESQIGEDWLDEYLLSHDHITSDTHERADYQFLLLRGSQPEFHMDINTPQWRHGSFVADENLDYFMSEEYDITSNLNAFEGRALFISGELTLNELPGYMDLNMEYYSNSELITVSNTGHTGVWEKPSEVSEIIRSFLK